MRKHCTKSNRNYGYGKQLAYAAKQALDDRYGEGKFATRASHAARFKQFAQWCKEQKVNDMRKVTSELVSSYAQSLSVKVASGKMSVSYAQNILSSVNVVVSIMRGDDSLRISPSQLVGERGHIRMSTPLSLNRELYLTALSKLTSNEAKLAVQFAREFGMRLREAGLFNPHRAILEVKKTGVFNIQRGVKGGRTVARLITVNARQFRLLVNAERVLGKQCLVDKFGNYSAWRTKFYKEYETSGAQALIGKFHDNRAAFACDMYKKLSGADAPVVNGYRTVAKELDKDVRLEISKMLGHARIEVAASYIGSAK